MGCFAAVAFTPASSLSARCRLMSESTRRISSNAAEMARLAAARSLVWTVTTTNVPSNGWLRRTGSVLAGWIALQPVSARQRRANHLVEGREQAFDAFGDVAAGH